MAAPRQYLCGRARGDSRPAQGDSIAKRLTLFDHSVSWGMAHVSCCTPDGLRVEAAGDVSARAFTPPALRQYVLNSATSSAGGMAKTFEWFGATGRADVPRGRDWETRIPDGENARAAR